MFGGFFPGGFPRMPAMNIFEEHYICYSISFFDGKSEAEKGDKIILPPSAMETLANMTVSYPLQFKLINEGYGDAPRETHVGVLEFTAEEGRCYLPYWVMQNLLLKEGSIVKILNVTLSIASFVKFRPQHVDFLKLSNPKAVLENTLRGFSCLTKGDHICISYGGKNYYIDVVDLKPNDACSIVEADVQVDFEAPPGYVEPSIKSPAIKPGTPPIKPGTSFDSAGKLEIPSSAASVSSKSRASSVSSADGVSAAGSLPSAGGQALGTSSASASGSGTSANQSLAELAKAREERRKQLKEQEANYIPFSGSGRRVDEKPPKPPGAASSSPSTSSLSIPPSTSPMVQYASSTASSSGLAIKDTSSKWKEKKSKGAAFYGSGHSLS